MKNAEEYPYCLDCWKTPVANPDNGPGTTNQEGSDNREELEARAEHLWRNRQKNGYQCLILYHDIGGDDWHEIKRWQ